MQITPKLDDGTDGRLLLPQLVRLLPDFDMAWPREWQDQWFGWVATLFRAAEMQAIPAWTVEFETDGWQPIETAPDIGKRTMLVFCSEYRNTYTAYREAELWFHAAAGNRQMMETPTHWMAIPPQPNASMEAREKQS